jgi:hypothetical protein
VGCVSKRGITHVAWKGFRNGKLAYFKRNKTWEFRGVLVLRKCKDFSQLQVTKYRCFRGTFLVTRLTETMRSKRMKCQEKYFAKRREGRMYKVHWTSYGLTLLREQGVLSSLFLLFSFLSPGFTFPLSHFYKRDKSVTVWHGTKSAGCSEISPSLLSKVWKSDLFAIVSDILCTTQ